MFVVSVTYLKPIEEIDRFLQEHRNYLETQYQQELLVCSGPQNPRTGGIIIARTMDRAKLDEILRNDPFQREGLAQYTVTEFSPVKMATQFAIAFHNEP